MTDHRKLGRELGLFTTNELLGAGLPIWLPREAESGSVALRPRNGDQVSLPLDEAVARVAAHTRMDQTRWQRGQ